MRYLDKVIDIGDDVLYITKQKPKDMARARKLVLSALNGELGFSYPLVRKTYTSIGKAIQRDIRYWYTRKMNHDNNATVYRISETIAELKEKLKRYEVYDEQARRTLYNNHSRLRKALDILVDGNAIRSYTLLPSKAYLKVTWADEPYNLEMPTHVIEHPWRHITIEPMEMSKAQAHFIQYIQGELFCGHVTRSRIDERLEEQRRKLNKTQIIRIRKGLSVDEKVIHNVGINAQKFSEDIKYERKRMSNGVLEKPTDTTRKRATKPKFEEFKGFTPKKGIE